MRTVVARCAVESSLVAHDTVLTSDVHAAVEASHMLERLVVRGLLGLRGTTCACRRSLLLPRLGCAFRRDTARDTVGVPLADHHVSIELLQMHDIAVHVVHGLLNGGEVVDHELEVLVKIVDLAVDQVYAVVHIRFERCPLNQLVHTVYLAVLAKLDYFNFELLKLLFELLVPRSQFLSDYLANVDIILVGVLLLELQVLDFHSVELFLFQLLQSLGRHFHELLEFGV